MTFSITITEKGWDELSNTLLADVRSVTDNQKLVEESARKVANRVKQMINLGWRWHHPTHRGALSKSIFHSLVSKHEAVVGSKSPYALAVFEGTRPHLLNGGKPVRITTYKRGKGLITYWAVTHKGSEPHNYLEKGLEVFWKRDLEKIMSKYLKKFR